MSTTTSRTRDRAGRLLHLIAAATIVVVLVLKPPALPQFGPSLATPLTTSTLAQLALLLAWIVLLVLALALLQRALAPHARPLLPPPWASRFVRRSAPVLPRPRRHAPPVPRLIVAHRAPPKIGPREAEDEPSRMRSDAPIATVALLGPVTIAGVRRPRRGATLELLAYLALHREGAERDEVLEAMWPGRDPRRTRSSLWQSVSEARRLLGDAFERENNRYRLDRTRVRIDVDELDRLLPGIDTAPSPAIASSAIDKALALWRGPPLAGSDYAWADTNIRQLQATLANLAERAARHRLDTGNAHAALQIAERGLTLDELNETFVRLALEAESMLGRRESMTERYGALRKLLDERLGLEPDRKTRLLYRQLLAQA